MKNLGIAYGMKRKKMAKGGMAESAKSEKRPMPDDMHDDNMMASQNSEKKDQNPMMKRPKTQPLKHPSMAQSPVFKVKMRDQEDHLESTMPPSSPKDQPPQDDNEMEAKKSGPSVPALHMKKMAEGGEINEEVSMHEAEEDHAEHPAHLEEDDDQMRPSEEDIMADHFADGGEVEEERHNSIAAAIMARRDRMHAEIDSGAHDLDHAVKMAEGGMAEEDDTVGKRDGLFTFPKTKINGEDSIYSDDSSQVNLKRNSEEDANMEDQTSFNALRKENYSESAGLAKMGSSRDSNLKGDSREEDEENKKDMISSIRSKMNAKRQFPK